MTLTRWGIVVFVLSIAGGLGLLGVDQVAQYHWDKDAYSYWSLAEKASTIAQKSEYVDKFVAAVKVSVDLTEHNAIFLRTPDNSAQKNLEALLSLQSRLKEIKKMDVSSFAYQQAIQQITAQEQGEASDMIKVLQGVYTKSHYPIVWEWFGTTLLTILLVSFAFGWVLMMVVGMDDWRC